MNEITTPPKSSVRQALTTWGIGLGVAALIALGVALLEPLTKGPRDVGFLLLAGFGWFYLLIIPYSVVLAIIYAIKRQWIKMGIILMALGTAITVAFGLCCALLMIKT